MRVLCKHFAKTCSELDTPWSSGKGCLFLSTKTTVPKPAGFSGHFFFSSYYFLLPFHMKVEESWFLLHFWALFLEISCWGHHLGETRRGRVLLPSWSAGQGSLSTEPTCCGPAEHSLLTQIRNYGGLEKRFSTHGLRPLWWSSDPSFLRGHLRPSEDMEICAMIHNSSKILVMK